MGDVVPELADVPLALHASYSREEILAALGWVSEKRTPATMREGVAWREECDQERVGVDGDDHVPRLRTQPATVPLGVTVHDILGVTDRSALHPPPRTRVAHSAICGREAKTNALGASPYIFLGPADYVSHTGRRAADGDHLAVALRNADRGVPGGAGCGGVKYGLAKISRLDVSLCCCWPRLCAYYRSNVSLSSLAPRSSIAAAIAFIGRKRWSGSTGDGRNSA